MQYIPKASAGMVMGGIFMGWFLAPLILCIAVPASMVRSYYSSNDGAVAWIFIGVAVALAGLICLLVGVKRALTTIDFLGRKAAGPAAEKLTTWV